MSGVKIPAWQRCPPGSKGLSPGAFPQGSYPGEFPAVARGPDPSITGGWESRDGIFAPRKKHQQGPHGAVSWLNWLLQVQKILNFLELSNRSTHSHILWRCRARGSPKTPALAPGGTHSPQIWSFQLLPPAFLPGDPGFPTPPPTPSHTNPALSLPRSHPSGKGLCGSAAGRGRAQLRAGIPKRNP